jgi:HEPN domain-containing protein/predicted nucleotidyltransferase
MTLSTSVDQAVLDDIVRRIVEVGQPERIILFGSAARGEMGPDSDLDLLVIKGGEYHRSQVTGDIYRGIAGVDYAVDVVVVTPEAVERYGNSHSLVIKPALREGLVIFDEPSNKVPRKVGSAVRSGRFAADDPRAWIQRARSNLNRARARSPDFFLEDLCFDAQQAAEKAIKAVFIARDIEFPYIHDLARLLNLLEGEGEVVPDEVRHADQLIRFAVATRYPDLWGSVTEEDYNAAVVIATSVVTWAEERLQTYLVTDDPPPSSE